MPPRLAALDTLQATGDRADGEGFLDPPKPVSRSVKVQRWIKIAGHHLKHHVGVGIICSVAYFDPGNWSVDLQAGSQFGYRPMLFVLLLAGIGAMILQSLSFKLGCVTGFDLASHCRLLLHDRSRHRRLIRYTVLYPLYVLCEIAIISTDLAELLGSAIGLCLLFPTLPLWAGVLITASDVLVFLLMGDPSRGQRRSVKIFEFTIIVLVFAVFACFVVLLFRVHPDWPQVFLGYVPSKTLFDTHPNALYTAVGILGATVMPHALFLGSFLATRDRLAESTSVLPDPATTSHSPSTLLGRTRIWFNSLFEVSRSERKAASRDYRDKYGRENNELSFIQAHLTHGLVDVVFSLLAIAVPVNSAILIIAATVFHGKTDASSASLFDMSDLIKNHIGKAAAFLFALALLCAGQTASITATLAGQVVSEGFIEWRISPFLRRMITRMLGLIPSMIVAIAVGKGGINTLLVASQVVLSIVLPFVAFPLIYLTSSKTVMRVRKPVTSSKIDSQPLPSQETLDTPAEAGEGKPGDRAIVEDVAMEVESGIGEKIESTLNVSAAEVCATSDEEDEFIDYSNGWLMVVVTSIIFVVVVAANIYAIVVLAIGGA
ncbi:natural resistance-associated macrophage protein [Cristinia sonorae]|uniref:Natural resistance-associated macrophage protein n=1 Tax=Cristinia sonorae TaxID=1940300 RepID=A0A8K0UN66_9AGAR|nr:natural resistance-associated macrophage protein [Cristinia sonorae]